MESIQESVDDILIVFEDTKHQNQKIVFDHPVGEAKAETLSEVYSCLQKMEDLRSQGYYLAGYISYEAGYAFLPRMISHSLPDYPLIHFYAFKEKKQGDLVGSHLSVFTRTLKDSDRPQEAELAFECPRENAQVTSQQAKLFDFKLSEDLQSYSKKIKQIHDYQKSGDTYQVNYTVRQRAQLLGSCESLYENLKKYQKVEYSAFLKLPRWTMISLSPELFLRKSGTTLTSKPMKGTVQKFSDAIRDDEAKKFLLKDEKTISENVMIVDLLRNDLARVCVPATVEVKKLFDIESYETVHQMVSTIECQVDPNIKLSDLFVAMFPCGSITGAPKLKTMEIISELEGDQRGIYTGAIGYIAPDNDMCLSVAIRTLVVDAENNVTMGVGGGILIDSHSESEHQECEIKSQFLKKVNSSFYLIETFLGSMEGFQHLDLHLRRLKASATCLGFIYNEEQIKSSLNPFLNQMRGGQYKLRLTLQQDGSCKVEGSLLQSLPPHLKVGISAEVVDAAYPFFRWKTSERELYEREYARAQSKGYYDVLFFNKEGNLSEASRHNIFIKKNNKYLTPPLSAGALPGVMRSLFIESSGAEEKELTLQDLKAADEVLLTNSVRGCVPVTVEHL